MKNKYLLVCLVVANSICANIDPGSLDDSFGTSGLVITDFNDVFPGGGVSEINSLVLQADGKIVAGGSFSGICALARYNADGTPDDSFGTQGLVMTDFNDVFPGGGSSRIESLVLQADGKIVAGGLFNGPGAIPNVFALARYNTDGTLDDSFGTQGLVMTDFNDVFPGGGSSRIESLVLQADGKIVAGGLFNGPGAIPNVFALARYNTDGTPDDSFGDQGLVMTDFNEVFPGGSGSFIRSLVLQADGKIVAGGLFNGPGAIPNVFALARYNRDGAPDHSFGDQGLVMTDFNDVFPGGGESEIYSLVVQADGKIVAGGLFNGPGAILDVFALARYNTDGAPDDSFGTQGLVMTDFNDVFPGGNTSEMNSLVLQADGKIVAGGSFNNGSDNVFALARYNRDGAPDDSFGTQGLVMIDFNDVFPGGRSSRIESLVLQADGKIVAGGCFFDGSDNIFALARYNTGVATSKIPQSIFGKYAKNTDKNKQLNW